MLFFGITENISNTDYGNLSAIEQTNTEPYWIMMSVYFKINLIFHTNK